MFSKMSLSMMEHAFHPALVLSCIFGVASFTPSLKRNIFYPFYSVFIFAVLFASNCYSLFILYEMNVSLYSNTLRLSLDRFQFFFNTFTAALSIICSLLYRAKSLKLIKDLDEIDQFFKKNGSLLSFDRQQYLTGSLLRFFYVSIAIILEHNFVVKVDSVNRFVFFINEFLPLYIAQFVECQQNVILSTIEKRYSSLLDKLLLIKSKESYLSKQSDLESLVKVYNSLVECCEIINEIYGKQILLIVGNIFFLVTANSDYVAEGIINSVMGRYSKEMGELFAFGYWMVIRFIELWCIVKACESVVIKAKDFSSSLYQYMIEEGGDSCKNKKVRLHLTVQKEPNFSAYGFFPTDITLIHSIIVAATTYLVILIQFSQTTITKNPIQYNITGSNDISFKH